MLEMNTLKNWVQVFKNKDNITVSIGGNFKNIRTKPVRDHADCVHVNLFKDGVVEVTPVVDGRELKIYGREYTVEDFLLKLLK